MDATGIAPDKTKIQVRGLEFFYNNQRSLKSINMDIPEKRITAIIGPSGCGKSTMLRVFNRIYSMYPNQSVLERHAVNRIIDFENRNSQGFTVDSEQLGRAGEVSAENFDEAQYLQLNEDVRLAISTGVFSSGYQR